MAICMNDDLAQVLGTKRCDRRFELWLWYRLSGGNIDRLPLRMPFLRDAMAKFISQNGWSVEIIKHDYDGAFVSENLLEWVKEDAWQCLWIERQLVMTNFTGLPLMWRDKSILMIDVIGSSGVSKQAIAEKLESRWKCQVKKDGQYKKFFAESGEIGLSMLTDWARKYVANYDPGLTAELRPRFSELLSAQALDSYFSNTSEALIYLNQTLTESEAKLCFDAIKKRWSQTKYRNNLEKNNKKQCNIVLTKKSSDILKMLSDRYLLSQAQIMEILIRYEAEQKLYLPAWSKMAKGPE